MAVKQKKIERQQADLNPIEMKSAIPKLERRIKELGDIDLNTVNKQFDPRFESLKCKINDTLAVDKTKK